MFVKSNQKSSIDVCEVWRKLLMPSLQGLYLCLARTAWELHVGCSELILLFWAKWNQNWVFLTDQNFPHHGASVNSTAPQGLGS